MANDEYELVPVTPIKRLEKKMRELESSAHKELPVQELNENIEKLSEQLSKLVTININLQSKMTELLIKITEQTEEVSEMIELLKKASEIEEEVSVKEERKEESFAPIISELKKLSNQNTVMIEEFKRLGEYISKAYTKGLITRAVQTAPRMASPAPPRPPMGGRAVE